MGTQILGRTTDEEDLKCLKNMALDMAPLLPQLVASEWIVSGIITGKPKRVLVRDRYSLKF